MSLQIGSLFDENLITPRKHKQLMNQLLREEMEAHRDKTLPKHFVLGANTKYNYKPITAGYAIKKKKKVHHLIPMVFTGRMKDVIRQTSRVTATSNKSTLYARNYFPMKDEFRSQVEVVLPSETLRMSFHIAKKYANLVNTTAWARKRSRSKK